MKIIDVVARSAKESASIHRKIEAFVKKNKSMCNMGALTFSEMDGIFFIELENDGELSDYLSDFIRKSETATLISAKNYPGSYDWPSDTYARPSTVVTFKF